VVVVGGGGVELVEDQVAGIETGFVVRLAGGRVLKARRPGQRRSDCGGQPSDLCRELSDTVVVIGLSETAAADVDLLTVDQRLDRRPRRGTPARAR
jgi:hypothetical protein